MVEAAYGTKSGTDSPIYCLKRGREANLYPRALYWILISHPSQRLSSNLIQVYGSRRCLHTRIRPIVATPVAIFTLYLCDILRGFVNENHMCRIKGKLRHTYTIRIMYMSHFAYACKMRYPLNLVLESWEYLWFYWTFCIVILDYGLKLHKPSNHTLVMLQKWLEKH